MASMSRMTLQDLVDAGYPAPESLVLVQNGTLLRTPSEIISMPIYSVADKAICVEQKDVTPVDGMPSIEADLMFMIVANTDESEEADTPEDDESA